jgi:hypothetical protein
MFIRFLFSSFLIFITCSCQPIVGGSCSYETHIGLATIVKQQDNTFLARFDPGQETLKQHTAPLNPEMFFPVNPAGSTHIGDRLPAELAVITEGSCTPYQLTLLITRPHHTSSIFIDFTENGQLTDRGQQKVKEIARLFLQLKKDRPAMNIRLCGQSQPQGTEEYNLFLSQRYSKNIADLLENTAVPHSRIIITAQGEHDCCSMNYNQNGVYVSFEITAK